MPVPLVETYETEEDIGPIAVPAQTLANLNTYIRFSSDHWARRSMNQSKRVRGCASRDASYKSEIQNTQDG